MRLNAVISLLLLTFVGKNVAQNFADSFPDDDYDVQVSRTFRSQQPSRARQNSPQPQQPAPPSRDFPIRSVQKFPISATTASPRAPVPQIVKQINDQNPDGSYTFGYESQDGSYRVETRGLDGIIKGKYGYLDATGALKEIEYTAGGKFGYEPKGEGIMVPPRAPLPKKDRDPFDYDYDEDGNPIKSQQTGSNLGRQQLPQFQPPPRPPRPSPNRVPEFRDSPRPAQRFSQPQAPPQFQASRPVQQQQQQQPALRQFQQAPPSQPIDSSSFEEPPTRFQQPAPQRFPQQTLTLAQQAAKFGVPEFEARQQPVSRPQQQSSLSIPEFQQQARPVQQQRQFQQSPLNSFFNQQQKERQF